MGRGHLPTPGDAKAQGLIAVTEDGALNERVETIDGTYDYAEWCRREALRLAQAGRRALVAYSGTTCAVWAEPPPCE